jgi:hypothetical protein
MVGMGLVTAAAIGVGVYTLRRRHSLTVRILSSLVSATSGPPAE